MAEETRQGDWGLRLQAVEANNKHLKRRLDEVTLELPDLRRRVEKLENWWAQTQESDPKLQERVSSDTTGELTQVFSDTVEKEDESVCEMAVLGGPRAGEADISKLGKEIEEVSVAVDTVEGFLELESLCRSLQLGDGEPLTEQGTTQDAGKSERRSMDEKEEFEDENREQEELRQQEKPVESGESFQDLAASSEKKEHFEPGAEEVGEHTAEESGTALSERVRMGEGAEDSKRGDEEKGSDYELEALEVEGYYQEGRLAEEAEKQEETAQEMAEDEEETEHDYISERVKSEEFIIEATLEYSGEMEKSLSGERRKRKELAKRKRMEEDDEEKKHELQLVGTEWSIEEESSEQAERGMYVVAEKQEEAVGGKIQVEEKKDTDLELVPEMGKGVEGASSYYSTDSTEETSEQAKQTDVLQRNVEQALGLITDVMEDAAVHLRLSRSLKGRVREHITKMVESSLIESNQKVHALETENNHLRRSLRDEMERLQTALLRTVKKNNDLTRENNDLHGALRAERIKQREFERSNRELIAKCRAATANVEESMIRGAVEGEASELKAKLAGAKKKTGKVDEGTSKKKKKKGGQMSVEGTGEDVVSFVQLKRHLEECVMRAVGILPMEEHTEVEKVEKDESLEECRRTLLERVQGNPDIAIKAIEAVLCEHKEKEVSILCHSSLWLKFWISRVQLCRVLSCFNILYRLKFVLYCSALLKIFFINSFS
jgi:hypothetical protein